MSKITSQIVYYFFSYFSVALALSLFLVSLMRPLSFRLGAVDEGKGRRVHKGAIPRLGGVGIFLAFTVPFIFSLTRGEWDAFHGNMLGILIGSTIIFLTGVYDDMKGLRVRNKLVMEVIAALLIYAWGIRISIVSNPFGAPVVLGWVSLPATVLWIIVITNAINLIDGLDGLAAGTVIFISATLFTLSGGDTHLQLTYVMLAGSLLGFLRYNFPPATIFMGDSGSLFLGFFLGSLSIISSHKATAIATMMVPVLAFSLPLLDMFYAVIRRYFRGMPLGQPDKEHIHHKLLDRGLSKRKVLLFLYLVNVNAMLIVLLFVRRQMNVDFFGLILVAVVAVFGLRAFGYIEFVPFIKEIFRGHDMARKRKYFSYVIARFRREAAKSRSAEDFKASLTTMVKEYNFSQTEIHLDIPGIENPFYFFTNAERKGYPLKLSFPLFRGQNEFMGYLEIRKQIDDDYFLCTAEMVRALSEEVSRFVLNNLEPGNAARQERL